MFVWSRTVLAAVPALLLVWFLPVTQIDAAQAAAQCLSRSEARKQFPRAYLYWRKQQGKRCWSDRRGNRHPPRRAALVSAGTVPTLPVAPASPQQLPRPLPLTPPPQLEPPPKYWPRPRPVYAFDEPAPWEIWPPPLEFETRWNAISDGRQLNVSK